MVFGVVVVIGGGDVERHPAENLVAGIRSHAIELEMPDVLARP